MADSSDIPYKEFGERLLALRKSAGMTRQQLGAACGIVPSTIVNYERVTRVPYADTAVKMAQTFHMTVEELLGMENPELVMAKEEAVDKMRSVNGKRGADRLQQVYREAASLAGGDLTEEQLLEFSMEMSKMAILAQQRLRELHTGKQYQATVAAKAQETARAVREIDDAITAMQSEKE